MMPSYLCLTIRFLQPYFHGRSDGNEPEWPPSPLRVFQAIVAAAGRWQETCLTANVASALHWLENRESAPKIVAPIGKPATAKFRLYVPDNVTDKVAKSWSAGREATIADYRTEKDVYPTKLEGDTVYYLYAFDQNDALPLEILRMTVRSITHLGWGIDMVSGNAEVLSEEEVAELAGERWLPATAGTGSSNLRVPVQGTLEDLSNRHQAFLHRITRDERGNESFDPVPPLSAFRVQGYRRATDPPPRRIAAFTLLKPDASGYRAFDTTRRSLTVAGMMRCAMKNTAKSAKPDESKWIDTFVLGHGENSDQPHQPVGPNRFAYLPLPSIEARGEGRANVIGPVRRVLVTVLADGHQREIDWAGQALSGAELVDERSEQTQAILSRIPVNDKMVRRYTNASAIWSTVTPMVLPGYDDPCHYRRRMKSKVDSETQRRLLDKLEERIDSLIRKAIGQAGFSDTLREHALIEWRSTGYWPGTELASSYGVPDHLRRFSRYHVRLQWRDSNGQPVKVPGPICIGGGRYYGLGLFAAVDGG
jgi:CRISPR-associated protein Csb2